MKTRQLKKNSGQRVQQGKWATILVGLFVAAVFIVLFFFIWGNRVSSSDYEGRIVDRWSDYSHTDEGSRPYFRLLVESNDGKRFTVKVDSNVYESARVGMHIRSRSGQVVLIDSEKNPVEK